MTRAEFDSEVSTMTASSAWTSGTDAKALAYERGGKKGCTGK